MRVSICESFVSQLTVQQMTLIKMQNQIPKDPLINNSNLTLSPMEWMMINLTRSQSSLSHLSRRARGVMGRMALLLPLALPSVTLLASRASSTCDPNRDDRRRGLISCWMDTFISFTSVERQLVVWCPHLPGRLQVPCKLSLGSQDVSSGNTNTKSSLQDKKMFGGYKTSNNN